MCAPITGRSARLAERRLAAQGFDLSRGGWGSKLHLVTERCGKPITVALTARQRHESPQAIPLPEQATEPL